MVIKKEPKSISKEKLNHAVNERTNKRIKRNIIISICLIIFITFIAFSPSLKNDFTNWDDPVLVTENAKIRDLSLENIKDIFTSYHYGLFHPLVLLSYSVEYHFFKLNPYVYHTTNLMFHLLNCLLVFWLIFLVTGKVFVSFLVGILFGIHPLHVESVAWISERKDVLYAFFFLGAIISYIYYHKKKISRYFYISLFMFILSLLSKPMAITLPFILLLCDYLFHRKFNRNILLEKIPFFVISIIFGIITIFAQKSSANIRESQSFLFNIFIASHGLIFYLTKMILPIKLSCFYMYSAEKISELPCIFLFSPIIVLIFTALIFYLCKNTRKIYFGGLFFLITILPVIQLISIGRAIAADRYTYIPLIGLFYISGEGFCWLYYYKTKYSNILKVYLVILLVGIIITFSSLSRQRCQVWKDSITLWNNVIENYPNVPEAYNNRGGAYGSKQDYDKAIIDYNEAIKIDPDWATLYNNRALVYYKKNEYDKAISGFSKAIKIDPNYLHAYINRGSAYNKKGEYDKAIIDYNEAMKIDPDSAIAYDTRGLAYDEKGEHDKAIHDYSHAIKIDPNYLRAYINRGNAYNKKGEYDKAIIDYNETIKIDPDSAITYVNRGLAYGKKGEYDKAIHDHSHAIKIDPNKSNAYYNRAIAYYNKGEYSKAWEDVIMAQKLGYKIDPKIIDVIRKSTP